jgi:hypothetical protein
VDWIHVAQDRIQWRAVVNTMINPRVPQNTAKRSLLRGGSCAVCDTCGKRSLATADLFTKTKQGTQRATNCQSTIHYFCLNMMPRKKSFRKQSEYLGKYLERTSQVWRPNKLLSDLWLAVPISFSHNYCRRFITMSCFPTTKQKKKGQKEKDTRKKIRKEDGGGRG